LPVFGALALTGALLLWAPLRLDSERHPAAAARHPSAGPHPRPGALAPGWPSTLELGMADPSGGAAALAASGFGMRYQYLSGGVAGTKGWQSYGPGASFIDSYVDESVASGLMPIFSYYMLLQSAPPAARGGEREIDLRNLASASLMRAYFRDIETFLRYAGALGPHEIVLHVEPDLWGYIEQSASGDDASSVPALVSATGLSELRGLPNNAAGLAQAIVRLRDQLAPNVLLAYHLSVFGTGKDLLYSKPSLPEVGRLAARSARFYRSLKAPFDLVFSELSNRDAAYSEVVLKDHGASWWHAGDYARELRYLTDFVRLTAKHIVLWQIPVGNTLMRALDNTPHHYQDNHVQWLLSSPHNRNLRALAKAGVIALLFGGALAGDTCACDAAHDGVTNPPPIDGNKLRSYSADDDGGYLRARALAYAHAGAIALP
jgi:hypothetical protein